MSVDPTNWNDGDGDCPECGEYAVFHSHPSFPDRTFVVCVEGGDGEFEVDGEGERVVYPPTGFVVFATPDAMGTFGMGNEDDGDPF